MVVVVVAVVVVVVAEAVAIKPVWEPVVVVAVVNTACLASYAVALVL